MNLEKYKDWRLWLHYMVLSAVVITYVQAVPVTATLDNSFMLFLAIAISDIIIHLVFEQTLGWKD